MRNDKKIYRTAALGFFDGVHIGHQAILGLAAKRAKEMDAISCAFTFRIRPKSFFEGCRDMLIQSDAKKREEMIIRYGGVDEVVTLPFDSVMANMTYDSFIKDILIKKYNVCHLVMGWNYTCGKNKEGDIYSIMALCLKLGIGCDVLQPIKVNGEAVSSTRIRRLIAENNEDEAECLLGHKIDL